MFCWPWTWGWTWDPGAEHRPPASPALCGSHPPVAAWGRSAAQETHCLNTLSTVLVLTWTPYQQHWCWPEHLINSTGAGLNTWSTVLVLVWTSDQQHWCWSEHLMNSTGACLDTWSTVLVPVWTPDQQKNHHLNMLQHRKIIIWTSDQQYWCWSI